MRPNFYLVFGILLCSYLLFAGYRDLSIGSFFVSGKWGPKGQSSYHK